MLRAFFSIALACLGVPGAAEELNIYLMEVPPLTMNAPDRKGVVGDTVLEAMRRAGYQPNLIIVPSNRALSVVGSPEVRDTLIIPLARLAEREQRFTWISPIVKVNRAFFTLDRTVNSFDDARKGLASIGVSRGTAGVNLLLDAGIPSSQIYEINQGENGFRMLLARRIDAWFGPMAEGRTLRKLVDGEEKIAVGAPLAPTYNYLGCSKACNNAIVGRLSDALAAMEKDGTTRTIMRKYGALD
ncbi:substrate-binding periplasmic protein [Pseudoduganella sp. OTU4001]|uniref:substrate-binding periplasmic protein n=1 Tax=Pseudoduganella sp. OTU4001 TaxID=3043854 RepID=UPI00313AD0E1